MAILSSSASFGYPNNEYWNGINDRHAALTRAAVESHLTTRWLRVVEGSVLPLLEKPGVKSSGETLLMRLLEEQHFQVVHFQPVSFILCCKPGPSCVHEAGDDRPMTKVFPPYCAKYPTEVDTVMTTLRALGPHTANNTPPGATGGI